MKINLLSIVVVMLCTNICFASQFKLNGSLVDAAKKRIEDTRVSEFERTAYKRIINKRIEPTKIAAITFYYPPERDARADAHGNRCTTRTAASNKLPQYTIVWIEGIGIRQILDTGAKFNDRKWCFVRKRRIADLWIDVWVPAPRDTMHRLRKVAIVRYGANGH